MYCRAPLEAMRPPPAAAPGWAWGRWEVSVGVAKARLLAVCVVMTPGRLPCWNGMYIYTYMKMRKPKSDSRDYKQTMGIKCARKCKARGVFCFSFYYLYLDSP